MCILFATLVVGIQNGTLTRGFIHDTFLEQLGWHAEDARRASPNPEVNYSKEQRQRLLIRANDIASHVDLVKFWRGLVSAPLPVTVPFDRLPSAFPLGDRFHYFTGHPKHRSISVLADRCYVSTSCTEFPEAETAQIEQMLDGIARLTLGKVLGRELARGQAASVNGRPVADTLQGPRGLLIEIGAWARARGGTMQREERKGMATIALAGRTVVLALGADRARVDGQWADLNGFALSRDGRWYAPLAGLEAASDP